MSVDISGLITTVESDQECILKLKRENRNCKLRLEKMHFTGARVIYSIRKNKMFQSDLKPCLIIQ